MACDEEESIRQFVIKEEGEEIAVTEVNVDIGTEERPALNDVCRFCSKVLRIKGILCHSGLIFTRSKLQQKSMADRLADLGLSLRPSPKRSSRICNKCATMVDRLERDLAAFRAWGEEEKEGRALEKENISAVLASSECSGEKRDRSPASRTPRVLKKLRYRSPLSRRSVTQVITTFPSKTVVKNPDETEVGIIQHIARQNWRTAANLLATHKDLFDEIKPKILIAINEECMNLVNPNNGFMLWKTSLKDLKLFSFDNLVLDLKHKAPLLLSVFNTISNNHQDAACAALCIALRGRAPRMSAFAYHVNHIIARGGMKKEVFNKLSKMAITTTYGNAKGKRKGTAEAEGAASEKTPPEGELSFELLVNTGAGVDRFEDTEELQIGELKNGDLGTGDIGLENVLAPTLEHKLSS